jgi:hypothetical protein
LLTYPGILVNNTALEQKTITFNIPADIGPDGEYYSLAWEKYGEALDEDGWPVYEYGNTINLKGATGNWSQFELEGQNFVAPDTLPCSAYGCGRDCVNQHYPGNTAANWSNWTATQDCINACPGAIPVDLSEWRSHFNETSSESNVKITSSASTRAASMLETSLSGMLCIFTAALLASL